MATERHGGMIFTGENQRTWRKICASATLSLQDSFKIVITGKPVFNFHL
jgi:hypothetical protein